MGGALVTGVALLCRPDSQAVYKTLGQTVSYFLNVRLNEKKTDNMGSSDLPCLGVFLIWLVFWFCFVFGTKDSYKHSPAVVKGQASPVNFCDDPVHCFVIPAWRDLSGSAQLSRFHKECASRDHLCPLLSA